MAELTEWAGNAGRTRPPLIVVGSGGDTEALRLAIRSGAKDFLPQPVVAVELIAALQRVREEARKHARPAGTPGFVHAIVGAAGGAGTSFVATNLARMLAGDDDSGGSSTMLVDMDLNFAPLSHYLDLHPERGLLQALDAAESLDEVALAGFGARHRSGLRLLCTSGGPAVLAKDISTIKLARLLEVLTAHHKHVIIDLPHLLDNLTATVSAFDQRGTRHAAVAAACSQCRSAAADTED